MVWKASCFVSVWLLFCSIDSSKSFITGSPSNQRWAFSVIQQAGPRIRTSSSVTPVVWTSNNSWEIEDEDDEDDDEDDDDLDRRVEALLDNEEEDETESNLPNIERAWRYAPKPLLRIGSKGAHLTHGNSLRQLLEAHTVVKLKVNTRKYGSLEEAFEVLKDLAVESGAPEGIEIIHARKSDKTIMFGMPGTLEKIERGEFPPEPEPKED